MVVIARVEYKVAFPDTPIVVRQRVLYCCQCRVTRTERADLRFLNDFKKMWSSRSPSATDQRTVCNLYTRVRLRNRAVRVCDSVVQLFCLLVQFKACSSLRRLHGRELKRRSAARTECRIDRRIPAAPGLFNARSLHIN